MSFRNDVELTMVNYNCSLEEALNILETKARVELLKELKRQIYYSDTYIRTIADAIEKSKE
ncbi:MAG: hypothetical protein BZ138_08130 [Methanosphaera sp. rholeuAM270]|nr:MAG: hypothetical protein BZ138_08130 [Methanosphaera sp. rholeuAM270]